MADSKTQFLKELVRLDGELQKYAEPLAQAKEIQADIALIKKAFLQENKTADFTEEVDGVRVKVLAYTAKTFDSAKFKSAQPELYNEFVKETHGLKVTFPDKNAQEEA